MSVEPTPNAEDLSPEMLKTANSPRSAKKTEPEVEVVAVPVELLDEVKALIAKHRVNGTDLHS
ncbi:hypothetical protein [Thalassoglobus sp.]|uniref:hypothetical protein n=1 Tax=Thalassoglobus sp. TaxID=2795869 RepID=UPI003AA8695C